MRLSMIPTGSDGEYALKNRLYFSANGIMAINLSGLSGSGKTTLIRRTHEILKGRLFVQAIEGAYGWEADFEYLQAAGIPAYRIMPEGIRYPGAKDIYELIQKKRLMPRSLLFVEDPLEPVAPEVRPLGESYRVLVYSITEGDGKPLKYPRIFEKADLIVVNKVDLIPFTDFSWERFLACLGKIDYGGRVIRISCRTGVGLNLWREWIFTSCGERTVEERG